MPGSRVGGAGAEGAPGEVTRELGLLRPPCGDGRFVKDLDWLIGQSFKDLLRI